MTEPVETASRKALLSPVLAGVLLDLLDFATFGPIGLWAGAVVGGLAGYLLARAMGFARRWPAAVVVAGAYCMLPFTAFVPLATAAGLALDLRERTRGAREAPVPSDTTLEGDTTLEVDYRSSWDDNV